MFHVAEEHVISGIFIKHVLEDSPAGRNGTLKTGDRILQVGITVLCEHLCIQKAFTINQGPIVQRGIISLMLRHQFVKYNADYIAKVQCYFLLEKCENLLQKIFTFF